MLSRDEKILYVTNRRNIVAFDVQPDGTIENPKTIATLEAGGNGDGICIDSEGRLYVTSGNSGIQVFSTEGKFLGVIPLPRSASSCAFSGPNKKVLYAKGGDLQSRDDRAGFPGPSEIAAHSARPLSSYASPSADGRNAVGVSGIGPRAIRCDRSSPSTSD
jgi:SMP-30/gluconolaconase/LRE-like protein